MVAAQRPQITTLADLPEWDGIVPLDAFKAQRKRDIRRIQTAAIPMMSAVDMNGKPLYRMTSGGNWTRTSRPSSKTRKAVLERDGHQCIWCSSTTELEIDHIIRYVDGGSNTAENLRTLCGACHRSRGGVA